MEIVPTFEINKYLTEKKDIYELLSGEDFNYYLPPLNSNAITIEVLLGLGIDIYWSPKKDQITHVNKDFAKDVDKLSIYMSIKEITIEDMGF